MEDTLETSLELLNHCKNLRIAKAAQTGIKVFWHHNAL